MPQKRKGRLTRKQITSIVTASILIAVAIALIITNIFVPVKYLTSYLIFAKNLNTEGQMRVNFVDVGNSDCTIVELPDGKVLLIDGGDGTYSHNLKLLKELNSRGIGRIDFLVCSSVENGSAGGLAELMKYKSVDRIFAPYCPVTYISDGFKSFCDRLEKEERTVEISEYGVGVSNAEAGYFFGFVSPDVHTVAGGEYENLINYPSGVYMKDASAVIWLEFDGISFLFLGGTSQAVQRKILNSLQMETIEVGGRTINLENCNIVKVADHGSTEGAYAPMTDFLSPQEAIISVGANGMGYPTLAALANIQNAVGSHVYRTDECGTITVTVSDGGYAVEKEKI